MKINFKKIIKKNDTFIFWTLLVLSLDYLALFFIESILPGYVMPHLNLNILLLVILLGWLLLVFSVKKMPESPKYLLKIFEISFLVIFLLGVWFTLYNIATIELIVVFVLLLIIGFLLFKMK